MPGGYKKEKEGIVEDRRRKPLAAGIFKPALELYSLLLLISASKSKIQ